MLSHGTLLEFLERFPAAATIKTWWLAYSGGVDSQVLLHLLAQTGLNLQAVYIDHGLQAESRDWALHCENSCKALKIPFRMISVNAHPEPGESPEAAARKARYQALAELIGEQDCLLTAQHRDDQAETLLLQLFRGAGAAGLAAMPRVSEFSSGWHARPLLDESRKDILEYARHQRLSWVEDPSNLQHRYDRNFLRLQLMPVLKQRWPAINRILAQAAEQQAENKELLEQLAELDLKQLSTKIAGLTVTGLRAVSEDRQRNVLRYWIKQHHLPVPSRSVLNQIQQQMLTAADDANPEVRWSGVEMHRFKDHIYAFTSLDHEPEQSLEWQISQTLEITPLRQRLLMNAHTGLGLDKSRIVPCLQVRFRQGGERLCPAGRQGHHSLKKLFQEAGVPPWLRDRIPLIYQNGELIAVAGHWVADEYKVADDEVGLFPELISAK